MQTPHNPYAIRMRGIVTFFIVAIASVGVAGAHLPGRLRIRPAPLPAIRFPTPVGRPVGGVQPVTSGYGHIVPLARLPRLPARTPLDTAGRLHPMDANGNYLTVTTETGCGTTVGNIYNTGCEIATQFVDGPAYATGGDTLEDFYIPANSTNAVVDSTCTTGNNPYTRNAPQECTTLSTPGVWVFGTLDVTKNAWITVAYLPVGASVYLDTYSDQFDTSESSQFTAASGTDVYVKAVGLSASDRYEVYVESTSVSPTCVFSAPEESPAAPLVKQLCNPAHDTGDLTAPAGVLNVAWPLSAANGTGTYSVVVYDLTAQQRVVQRQVSLIATATTAAMTLTPVSGNPSPNPVPAGTPATTFAYDQGNENSDKDFQLNATGLPTRTNVIATITDPTGQVVQSWEVGTGNAGSISKRFTFGTTQLATNYNLDTYSVAVLNETTSSVIVTQAFHLVGYQVSTAFTNPSGNALNVTSAATISGLSFTNTGNTAYGTNNGDPIQGIYFDDGTNGITITLLDGTSCGANCQTETLVDTAGITWNVSNSCAGTGNRVDCTIYAFPLTTGQGLALGASLTLGDVQFQGPSGNNTCNTGCTGSTSVLPRDGLTWSQANLTIATNPVYFNNNNGATEAATGHIFLYGYRDGAGTLHANEEAHGYTVRALTAGETSVIYTDTSPTTLASNVADVYAVTITNTSSASVGAVREFSLLMPAQFADSMLSVDAGSPSGWSTRACPGGSPSSEVCFRTSGGNTGIPDGGGSQTIYIDVTAPPSASFAYTDTAIDVLSPDTFGVTPDGTWQVYTSTSNPQTVDSTALVAYSLNSSLMGATVAPAAIGTNTAPPVAFAITNTSAGADPFPDSIDAVVLEVPAGHTLSNFTGLTSGWSEIGSYTSGGNLYYWFGLCANEYGAPYQPPNNGMPACTKAIEQAHALSPGAGLDFTANVAAGGSAGTIAITMYAHGANGGGWSQGKALDLSVSALNITAGFSAIGPVGSPSTVPQSSEPFVGADSNTTYGNAYVYTVQNTSTTGAGNNLTQLTITIPGKDVSGVNGTDSSGEPWTITGWGPSGTSSSSAALSGSGFSGCSITSYSSATAAGADGQIVVGGSSCSLAPGGVMNVTFTAKAPYRVNDSYQFAATANSGTAPVYPTWTNDANVNIALSASINVTTDPSADVNAGTNPTPNCVGCTFGPSFINVGSVADGSTFNATDTASVTVNTDASSPQGWDLYVSTDSNPANTGSPSNEFLSSVDKSASLSLTGLTYDTTVDTVVPVSSPGLLLIDSASGTTARRNPFGFVMNFQVKISGGPTSAQTAVTTYTFIPN